VPISGLAVGGVVGIALGGIALVVIVILSAMCFAKYQKKKIDDEKQALITEYT
jgi:uncharacterized membrane protein YbaN (DUF454 family)